MKRKGLKMKKKIVLLLSVILVALTTVAISEEQEKKTIVFTGLPVFKISEGGISRVPEKLKMDKATEFKCSIIQVGEDFFWATRNNVQMVCIKETGFTTFVAINGSGYVRMINSDMKKAASLMGETEKNFDYVEHLLIGLRTVTYYGNSI